MARIEWIRECPDPVHWRWRLERNSTRDESGCLIWQGSPSTEGYGRFGFTLHGRYRQTSAHRAAWLAFKGDLAPDLSIDHLCRVKLCIEPTHLDAVPIAVNIQRAHPYRDAGRRQRPRAVGADYPCGHPRTPENTQTHTLRNGREAKACRTCIAARRRRKREEARGVDVHAQPWFMRSDAAHLTTAEVLAQMGMGA